MSMYVESSRDNLASDSWYSRRSKLEKSLLFSTIGLSALCLGLIIGLAIAASNSNEPSLTKQYPVQPGKTYPTLEGNSSKLILLSPCDDFFEYACQQESDEPLRKASGSYHDTVILILHDALSQDQRDEDPVAVNAARAFFRACMLNESTEDWLAADLREMGGWPIVQGDRWSDNRSEFEFQTLYVALQKVMEPSFMAIHVLEDNGNIVITVPGDAYGTNATISSILEKASSLGATIGERTRRDAEDIITFRDDLARHIDLIGQHDQHATPDQADNTMTVSELQELAGQFFHWQSLLEGILGTAISESTRVTVTDRSYLTAVDKWLFSSDARHIANYLLWCYVEAIAWHAGGAATHAEYLLEKSQTGITDREERWVSCTVLTDNQMRYATARLFLQEYIFPIFSEAPQILEFIEAIRQSIRDIVPRFNRRDKHQVIDTTALIGFPDWIMNDSVLDEYYSDVKIDQNFYRNVISLMQTANKLSDRSEQHNPLSISTGIDWESFFDYADKDSVALFGSVGTQIAHLIFRNFLREENMEEYECFVKRHDQYCWQSEDAKTQCINGMAQEIIADYAAVRAAYQAYHYWITREGTLEPIYVDDKSFFLTYAKNWCGDSSTLESQTYKYRVNNGPVSDFKAFAEAFRCQGEKTSGKSKCGFL